MGSAEYHLLYENDLTFKVEMTSGGHAIVTGCFQERPDKQNILHFEFDTVQSCLLGKTAVAWFVGFHVAAVCAVVIISFVFLIFGDNLFLPLVRPV